MIIDFKKIKEEKTSGFKGGEGAMIHTMVSDEYGKIIRGRLEPGSGIGLHTHETSSEYIFILSGRGECTYDGETEIVEAGQCHFCPKGHSHSMKNNGDEDLEFFCAVPEL